MADEKSKIVTDATGPDAGPAPVQPEAGGGKSRLNARMPRADHGNIISSCGISHHVHFLYICVNRFIRYEK